VSVRVIKKPGNGGLHWPWCIWKLKYWVPQSAQSFESHIWLHILKCHLYFTNSLEALFMKKLTLKFQLVIFTIKQKPIGLFWFFIESQPKIRSTISICFQTFLYKIIQMFILVFLPYKKAMTQLFGQRLVKILSDTRHPRILNVT